MNNRVKYIDVAKGILILCVLYGHVHWIFGGYRTINDQIYLLSRKWVYSFHMPAFFIISGFFIKKSTNMPFHSYILKKLRAILLPFFAFEILYRIIYVILGTPVREALYSLLKLEFYAIADWFLLSLFISSVLFYFLAKAESRIPWIRYPVIAALIALTFVQARNYYGLMLWRSAVSVLFLMIGETAHEKMDSSCKYHLLVVFGVLSFILSRHNRSIDMYYGLIGKPLIWLSASICGSFFIIELSKILQSGLLSDLLSFFGKHSLIIMGSHDILMKQVLKNLFHPSFSTRNAMMYFCLVVLIEGIIVFIYDRLLKCLPKEWKAGLRISG